MKFKYAVYALLALAATFAAVMAYLVYFQEPAADIGGAQGSRGNILENIGVRAASVRGQGRTVSGKSGKLVIAYAGDIQGSLDPCG